MQSFYRIQDRDIDTADLLDPEMQFSESYSTGTVRTGKSVCRSIEDLAWYFAHAGVPLSPIDSVLVELEGDWADEDDEDADLGAYLVIPTRVVSVTEIPDEFYAEVDRILDAA